MHFFSAIEKYYVTLSYLDFSSQGLKSPVSKFLFIGLDFETQVEEIKYTWVKKYICSC